LHKKRKFLRALMIRLPVYLAAIVALAWWGRGMFYYPDQVYYSTPQNSGLPFDDVTFASRDGTRLNGWFVPADTAQPARGTIIFMHGNAGNMTAHWPAVEWLPPQGFNVFLFDYRGYGHSAGRPTAKGLYEDTVGAIDYVRGRPDVDADTLLIFAQSLGGNNAIAALGREADSRRGVRAIAVDSTFYSYSTIANDKIYGSGLLMSDAYSADRFIASLAPIPLLLLHGTADPVVPVSHSEWLFARAGQPKRLVLIPDGEHLDALTDLHYRRLLVDFYENALLSPTPSSSS